MYEVPSRPDIKRCVITEESITDGFEPLLVSEGAELQDQPA
jgi:ATP-dependent protease Clp ATPase subunit